MLKTFDRFILIISGAVIVMLGTIVLASVAGSGFPNSFAIDFYHMVLEHSAATVAASVAVVLIVLYQVALALRPQNERHPISISTALGDVQISMQAVELIARRAAQSVSGVRDVEAKAESDGQGITVYARLYVHANVSIPATVENMERVLVEAFSESCGLPVKRVHTVVKGVGPEQSKLK